MTNKRERQIDNQAGTRSKAFDKKRQTDNQTMIRRSEAFDNLKRETGNQTMTRRSKAFDKQKERQTGKE